MSGKRRHPNSPPSIAIVGAGFAGLTLANYLSEVADCHIFEAKEEPIAIFGTIRLPVANEILDELNLSEAKSRGEVLIHRQHFLKLLRSRALISYGHRIEQITLSDSSSDLKEVGAIRWLQDSQGQLLGPFDCIIVACGLSYDARSSQLMKKADAVVGDARWKYDVWFWDFGRTRVQQGGNIALQDARELARAIMSDLKEVTLPPDSLCEAIPHKFRPRSNLGRWHQSKLLVFAILVAFLGRFLSIVKKI